MLPKYKPGDHVMTFNWGSIKEKDVVVFEQGNRYLIKRVYKLVDNYVYISGDNKAESSKLKPVKKEAVVGKVILKY